MRTGLLHREEDLVALLQLAAVDNGGALVVLDSAALRTGGLESLDDLERLGISHLTEDDVSRVKPRGDDRGDEELRAVARKEG